MDKTLSHGAPGCMQVRDWYVESFQELRNFKPIRDAESELKFTHLLRHIYHRHRQDPAVLGLGLFISAKI